MSGAPVDGVVVRRHAAAPAERGEAEHGEAEHGGSGRLGVVGEIVLDRPAVLNAIDTAMAVRLADVCTEFAADPAVRAVVMSGAGERAFCAGADLKERNGMSDAGLAAQRPVLRRAFDALRALPQPLIAAVAGYALGGGCELALCCDIIVADGTAVFGLTETTVGLVPGMGGTQLATRRVGPGRASELILTGRRVTAGEALRFGLADIEAPAGTARACALAAAWRIAANSPVAVRAAKRAIRLGEGIGLAAALEVEDAAWRTAAFSADRREGIAAFNDKRAPRWPGR